MIPLEQLPQELRRRLKKASAGTIIQVRTWKKDRGFRITVLESGYTIEEDGFLQATYHADDIADLLKCIRPIAKREFPRSNQLHIQQSR